MDAELQAMASSQEPVWVAWSQGGGDQHSWPRTDRGGADLPYCSTPPILLGYPHILVIIGEFRRFESLKNHHTHTHALTINGVGEIHCRTEDANRAKGLVGTGLCHVYCVNFNCASRLGVEVCGHSVNAILYNSPERI